MLYARFCGGCQPTTGSGNESQCWKKNSKNAVGGREVVKLLNKQRNEILARPPADDLINDLLPDSSSAYMLICGRSGIGKTFLALNLLYCLASGTPFLSHKTKQCKAGYLSFEGDRRKILTRFETIGRSFPDAKDYIHWEHTLPFPLNILGIEKLMEVITGLDVVGIDPLRPLVAGDYITPKDASAFLTNLRKVQNETSTTIILTHHIRKPDRRNKVQPEDLQFEIKGASEYVEAATTVLLMEKTPQPRGDFGKFASGSMLKNLHFVKLKDAPTEPQPATFRFNSDTMLYEPITDFFQEEGA